MSDVCCVVVTVGNDDEFPSFSERTHKQHVDNDPNLRQVFFPTRSSIKL